MIRTAILAGILLVMLSMAYNRPGALPSFGRVAEPVVSDQPDIAPVQPERASPRAEMPRAEPVAVAKQEEAAVTEPEAVAEPEVAEVTPEAVLSTPVREALPPVKAEPGKPISLLPETQTAATPARDPARYAPLVSDNMPAPPSPTLPQQVAKAEPLPAAELPEVHVPTRPVMVPQDYASRLMVSGVAAPVAAVPTPAAPQGDEARAPTIAPGTQFMTPEERSRELYRLAREMEDTFIKNLTH